MPVKGIDYDIIAGFPCPICDSDVKAHGVVWRCTNKGCWFRMARRWKRDPEGGRWWPKRSYYRGQRQRYLQEVGLNKTRWLFALNANDLPSDCSQCNRRGKKGFLQYFKDVYLCRNCGFIVARFNYTTSMWEVP